MRGNFKYVVAAACIRLRLGPMAIAGGRAILMHCILRDRDSIIEFVARFVVVYGMIEWIRRLQVPAPQHQLSLAALRLDLNQKALAQIARAYPQWVQLMNDRKPLMHRRQSRNALVQRAFSLTTCRTRGNIQAARHRGMVVPTRLA